MEHGFTIRDGLPRQLLEDVLEPELVKQYRLSRGENSKYMPVSDGVRYLCSCGAESPVGESCETCGLPQQPLTRQVLEQLRQEAQERLAYEEANAHTLEQQRKAEEEKEKKRQRRKRLLRILAWTGAAVAALALLVGGCWLTVEVIVPAVHYSNAQKALEQGDAQRAHLLFTLAGDYRDAEAHLARFYIPVTELVSTTKYQQSASVYIYDARGRLLTTTLTRSIPDLSGGYREEERTVFVNSYDEAGRVLEQHDAYGRTVYSYNEHGDVVRELEYRYDGLHDSTSLFVYEYDEEGRMLLRSEICSEHISVNYSFEQTDTFTYDEQGRLLTLYTKANYPASVEGNFESHIDYVYDEQGRTVEVRENITSPNDPQGSCRIVYTWEYDEQGRQIRSERKSIYPQDSTRDACQIITTVYDDRDRITEQIVQELFPGDPNRDSVESYTAVYDRRGNLHKTTSLLRFTDPQRQSRSGYSQVVEYTYDWFGRLTQKQETWTVEEPTESYVKTEAYSYGLSVVPKSCTRTTRWQEEQEDAVLYITYDENGMEAVVDGENTEDESVNAYRYAYFYIPMGEEMPEAIVYDVYN